MKVLVKAEVYFEVEVATHNFENAKQAVEANWESHYKHKAWWLDRVAPQYTARNVKVIKELR